MITLKHASNRPFCLPAPFRLLQAFLAMALISLGTQATAQPSLYDSVNKKRYKIARTGFAVLGSWAVLNIGTGVIGQQQTTGERKQFYRATIIGGLIDLAFAGVGYVSTNIMAGKPHTIEETFRKQALAEKVFLFSVGLDLSAIALGLYTKERANRFMGEKKDWLKGAGTALVTQGGALFLFDGMMYLLQAKNGARLRQKLQGLSFGPTQNGFGLVRRF